MPLFDLIAAAALNDGIVICRATFEARADEPAPLGWTDGLEVRVVAELPDSDAAWLAAHLYGHAAQWASRYDARSWDLGKSRSTVSMQAIQDFEKEADGYALALLSRVSPALRGWYGDRRMRDWRGYEKYLRDQGFCGAARPYTLPEATVFAEEPRRFTPGRAFEVPSIE